MAGPVPGYPEMPVSDGAAVPFHNAVRMLLKSHEPYPAYVVNRWWELVNANTAGRQFFWDGR